MAIVINRFDENVESGDSQTPDLTGSDNIMAYGGTGIDTTTGGQMDGATQGATNFVNGSEHDVQTTFGTRTFTNAEGHILDANIPTGANTFTQNASGTPFDDTTYHVFEYQDGNQSTVRKAVTTPIITYNLATPGSITYDIDAGGLAVIAIATNVNTPQVPSGWTQQGTNKSLSIITDYILCTRIAVSDETGTTVTPTMDGDGTGRGFSRVWVYNPTAAAESIIAESGSYTMTGTDADLLAQYVESAESTAYSYAGTDLDLLAQYLESALSGGYTYAGTDVDLRFGSIMVAESGSYALAGTETNLIGAFMEVIESGSYAYSGVDVELLYNALLVAETAGYSYSGTDVDLALSALMTVETGSYIITGTDVTLRDSQSVWTRVPATSTIWVDASPESTTWSETPKPTTIWTDI